MNDFPVPLQFTLPTLDWVAVEPESVDDGRAAFVATRRNLVHDVTPTITLAGERREDPATLVEIADASLAAAAGTGASVELTHRREVGSADAPGVTQAFALSGSPEGQGFDLRRGEVLLAMLDVDDPTKRIVVRAGLTCAADQFTEMTREFQSFVASISPAPTGQG